MFGIQLGKNAKSKNFYGNKEWIIFDDVLSK